MHYAWFLVDGHKIKLIIIIIIMLGCLYNNIIIIIMLVYPDADTMWTGVMECRHMNT